MQNRKSFMIKGSFQNQFAKNGICRARNWFLGNGSTYDELTGDLVCSDGIKVPRSTWIKVVKDIKYGIKQFYPDREKDFLTLVLGYREHTRRVRGLDGSFTWDTGLLRTKVHIEAEQEQSSDGRRRRRTSSTSC
jgi:hypothetical protein